MNRREFFAAPLALAAVPTAAAPMASVPSAYRAAFDREAQYRHKIADLVSQHNQIIAALFDRGHLVVGLDDDLDEIDDDDE